MASSYCISGVLPGDINSAKQISILMTWIEHARQNLKIVEQVADVNADFLTTCKDAGINFEHIVFDDLESMALASVCSLQADLLTKPRMGAAA